MSGNPTPDTDGWLVVYLFLIVAVIWLVMWIIFNRRQEADRRRARRVLETVELRLDKIEETMKALPALMLRAYKKLEDGNTIDAE